MKGLYFALIIILMLGLLLMPLCALSDKENNNDGFKVFITDTAKIENISFKDYLLGVTGNHLAPNASEEAIKAEAVAAYSLALYHKDLYANANFDFNDSLDGFILKDKLKEKWGKDYKACCNKFESAIKEVLGQIITYNNSPIMALRHDISSGTTECAADILKGDFPYLQSVESVSDLMSDELTTTKTISVEDFKKVLINQGLTPSNDPAKYITDTQKTRAGGVKSITVLGKDFTGEEMKNIFDLPSICFDVAFKDNAFIFTVKGKGDLLGLSRTGAEYLAQNGHTYTEILSWYYPCCELKT